MSHVEFKKWPCRRVDFSGPDPFVSQSDISKGSCPFGGLTQSLSNKTSPLESVILIFSGQSVSTQIVFDHGLSWFYHGTAFMTSQR